MKTNTTNKQPNFRSIFLKNEFRVLAGKSLRRILILILILTLTLSALGLAVGGYAHLQKKMDNPYTNWVNWGVRSASDRDTANMFVEYFSFENQENRDEFLIKSATIYNITFLAFDTQNGRGQDNKTGRVFDIATESELISDVLNTKGNVYWAKNQLKEDVKGVYENHLMGIVVTRAMLEELGYENPKNVRQVTLTENIDSSDYVFFIDVLAVVEELPHEADYLCTRTLYNLLGSKSFTDTRIIDMYSRFNRVWLVSSANEQQVKTAFAQAMPSSELIEIGSSEFIVEEGKNTSLYKIIFDQHLYPKERHDLLLRIQNALGEEPYFSIYTQYDVKEDNEIKYPHYVAFNFERLDKVALFKQEMKNRYSVNISMAQVEEKNNFAVVTQLTIGLALFLLGFSISSIVIFVNNLLSTHLEKVKMNLGTFKAFGLENVVLVRSYLKIIGIFLLVALIGASLITIIISLLTYLYFKFFIIKLWSGWIALAIILLLGFSITFARYTINKLLKNTPGDLIYNRT